MSSQPAELFTPPPSAAHAATSDGEVFLWLVRPEVVAEIASGVFSMPLAQKVIEFFDPIIASGRRVQVFSDFERLTHYIREARDLLTAHSVRNRRALEASHMLLSSKMVALGVSSFKHELGDPLVHTYSDRASFLTSYAKALARE
ncbi:MAG TPA: hypothetical protein VMT03_23385 [Polyangia bacterium]|nr:hypothetical protein [Polyangia bacterium]